MKMLFGLISTLFLAWMSTSQAQQLEQVEVTMPALPVACNGTQFPGSNQILYVENYFDRLLPNPIYITGSLIWNEGGTTGVLPSGITGNISVGVDPGKQYIADSGFPLVQNTYPQYLKLVGWLQLFPNSEHGEMVSYHTISPPVSYHAGTDAIVFAPECAVSSGTVNLSTYLSLQFQNAGDISSIPYPIVTYNAPSDNTSISNPPISVRMAFPVTTTGPLGLVRVRANAGPLMTPFLPAPSPNLPSVASHVSICIQSVGPNCVSTPVELKFLGNHGFNVGAGLTLWSDWTPFPVSVGQTLLAVVSFTAVGTTNAFGYKTVAPVGVWSSAADGWDAATMPGVVSFVANRTIGIDGVQQQ